MADTSITDCTNETNLAVQSGFSSSCTKGWANKLRSDQKIKKQQDIDQSAPGERSSTDQFHPTDFETYGRWSDGSTNFFKMIFSEVAKNEPSEKLPRMKSYWRNRISFSIARSDAKSIISKINAIREARGLTTPWSHSESLHADCAIDLTTHIQCMHKTKQSNYM